MATSVIDWTIALNTAKKLVKPGPDISREGAAAVVAELRDCANRAEAYVTQVTGLETPSNTSPVLVVDRQRWIQANLDGFRQVLRPLTAKAADRLSGSNPAMTSSVRGSPVWRWVHCSATSRPRCWDSSTRSTLEPKVSPAAGCCWSPPTSSP